MDLVVSIESLGDNHLFTRVVWSPQVSKLKLLQTFTWCVALQLSSPLGVLQIRFIFISIVLVPWFID